jgi:hypothetical protein
MNIDLIKSWLSSIIRHALSGAGVWFIKLGYDTTAATSIQNGLSDFAAGGVAIVVALGWSYLSKITAAAASKSSTPSA